MKVTEKQKAKELIWASSRLMYPKGSKEFIDKLLPKSIKKSVKAAQLIQAKSISIFICITMLDNLKGIDSEGVLDSIIYWEKVKQEIQDFYDDQF